MAGATLVELVVAILIISISLGGVLLVFSQNITRSVDPQLTQQAIAIAEAYLEEILLKPLDDPGGGETGGAESGESRSVYDDVQDYDGLNEQPPSDQAGIAWSGLDGYRVSVTVGGTTALGPGGDTVPTADVRRVDVRVVFNNRVDVTLTGYRADY